MYFFKAKKNDNSGIIFNRVFILCINEVVISFIHTKCKLLKPLDLTISFVALSSNVQIVTDFICLQHQEEINSKT